MNCSVAAGEQRAAQQALSVSEQQLQRIKQQGCFTTSQDQAIMRNPDYRALPYPALANPLLALEYDPNNKYTAINQAEGFISPFVDQVTNQVVQARPTVPGLSMAGTGDLAAIAGAYLEEEPVQKARVYQRIADSIRGGPARATESSQTRQGLDEAALHAAEVLRAEAAQMAPLTNASQVTAKMLYGAGQPLDFYAECKAHCRAALYDLMHYDAISEAQLREASCGSKLGYVAARGGRLPYLACAAAALLFFAYLIMLLWR